MTKSLFIRMLLCGALGLMSVSARADGMVVDKVYHPYVLPFEREVEWRLLSRQTDDRNELAQRAGLGWAIAETVTVEGYMIGERDQDDNFDLAAYELEARWQVVEQGRYWADWGMLFELEKRHKVSAYEATLGVLFEKEFGKVSLTMNAFAVREWGRAIKNEWESEFRAQLRYRFDPAFQPAIEVYTGEDFVGIGPAVIGLYRFAGQRQLKWEIGFASEVAHSGKDHSFRLALEFEF
ncbi:hypothetical protein BET10_14820 [Pseudoalteromonas amylolytica]|uniref:Copper resistance protein CopB n=2 Tax=Pseudoalteromonas TaxID=53246 RepID=A0A1S1MNR0_9GAMM|nr:hypothetical protein BFC16_20155 [Pseudoalteromonas sp. JW3]OHU90046.1 hypothetical protein BET10_14820 [Pseudoalteromonas amylolytica]